MVDLGGIETEQRNPRTMGLDAFSPLEIACVMNEESKRAVAAVDEILPQVAQAIEWAAESLGQGGRLIYAGAGSSGRLGVLDAAECPPTFGVSRDAVIALMAGGAAAMMEAVEGAEDDEGAGIADLAAIEPGPRDLVVGLSASGRTPYVLGALRCARRAACRSVAVCCTAPSAVAAEADLPIEVSCGPEVLTGSTRLKAATAQKLVLNMISTGAMVRLGKVYQNLMVDVVQSNEKLRARAQCIVVEACGCTADEAQRALRWAGGSVKLAIVMVARGCDADRARRILDATGGRVRDALGR